jgi:hypothetical protein
LGSDVTGIMLFNDKCWDIGDIWMSIKDWKNDIKNDKKKYSNIYIIQCHFAHQHTHVHYPLIVPGPPRWVVGHGTADRTFPWLQRTKVSFPFFLVRPLISSPYKQNSPWFITVLHFRDIPKFRRWVAQCRLNAPRWLIVVSGCCMQKHPASGCKQLSLTVGY